MDDQDDDSYARAPEPEDLVRICRALNDAGAPYVLMGGFAVLSHGASRFTKDIDLPVDDAPENVARVKQGLAVLVDNAAADMEWHDMAGVQVPIARPASLIRTKFERVHLVATGPKYLPSVDAGNRLQWPSDR